MKKSSLLTTFFLFAGLFAATAQLSLTPNPVVIEEVDITKSEVIAESTIKNGFDTAKDLVWSRTVTMLSEGWSTAVCDKNTCYLTTTETAEFNLAAGEENTLNVYIYPENVEGAAIVEVTITDKNDENVSVTGTYYFNAAPNSTKEQNARNASQLFPNPTSGKVRLSQNLGTEEVFIYGMNGQRLGRSYVGRDGSFDLSFLPAGIYLLQWKDQQQNGITTQLVNKY